jgi:hypothetical protein
MTQTERREILQRILWHPLLVLMLERFLPEGYKLLPEFQLGRMPQRIDIVVVRLVGQVAGAPGRLRSIFAHLRSHTLMEYKSPTDELEGADAIILLGYAMQYMALCKLDDPGELCLMVICDRIPPSFPRQIERFGGRFEPCGGGLWRGELCRLTLRGVETRTAFKGDPTERLLYALSRFFLKDPFGLSPLDEEEARVYSVMNEQIKQMRRKQGTMWTEDMAKEVEAVENSLEAALTGFLKSLSPDKLRAFLSPDVLQVLLPEERLAGLPPEQRLAGLAPDQILDALSPEMREALLQKLRH